MCKCKKNECTERPIIQDGFDQIAEDIAQLKQDVKVNAMHTEHLITNFQALRNEQGTLVHQANCNHGRLLVTITPEGFVMGAKCDYCGKAQQMVVPEINRQWSAIRILKMFKS